jgi:hypothetical protein
MESASFVCGTQETVVMQHATGYQPGLLARSCSPLLVTMLVRAVVFVLVDADHTFGNHVGVAFADKVKIFEVIVMMLGRLHNGCFSGSDDCLHCRLCP